MSAVTAVRAEEAFRAARRRAFFARVRAWLSGGRVAPLLSLDEVREKLHVRGQHYAGLKTIPIERIVGSAGRYGDFNREFLPEGDYLRGRWRRIYEVAHSAEGFPPIEVYQVGEAYFVRDGHHRVSVLRELGATTVEAYVTVLDTPVPLPAEVTEEELELKAEYADFLDETGLAAARPEADVQLSLPGQYRKLVEHIAVHRHYLGLSEQREIPPAEAVARWYDEVYLPLVRVVREAEILDQFPGRTEADLYLWILEHRHYLRERGEGDVPLEEAAAAYAREYGREAAQVAAEQGRWTTDG